MSGHGPSDSSRYDALLSILTSHANARRLRPDAIPDDDVSRILEAGRWAMSGANSQPWEFIVVRDAAIKRQLHEAYVDTNSEFVFWMEQQRTMELRHPAFRIDGDAENAWRGYRERSLRQSPWSEAPVVIVALGDGRRQWGTVQGAMTPGRRASYFTDSMANTGLTMHLAIAALGLAAPWITVHVQDPFKRILEVPDLLDVHFIIPVGYADTTAGPGERRPLDEMVHYDRYDMSKYMSNSAVLDYLRRLRSSRD